MPNNGMAQRRQTKRSFAGYLLVIILSNVFTYWFLCRPELAMKQQDPGGYSYLQTVLSHAGGIWALSTRQRCVVHCVFTTFLVLVVFAVVGVVSKYYGASRARKAGGL
jgi:hypothetical protein